MWQGLQSMGFSKLLAEGGYDILILKVEQDLKKLASCVRQGLQGMGCSKLLAEGGIRHTNFELHKGLFDRDTDTKLWKSSKKVNKNRWGRRWETLYFYSFIYSFIFRATAFSSIVRAGITVTPNPNPKVCYWGLTNKNAGWMGPHTVDSSGIWVS